MRNSTFTGIQPNSSEFAGYIKYTTPSESGFGFWNCSDRVIFFLYFIPRVWGIPSVLY